MKKILISLVLVLLMTSCINKEEKTEVKQETKKEVNNVETKEAEKEKIKVWEEVFSMKTKDIKNDIGTLIEDNIASEKNAIKAVKGLDKPGAIINKRNVVLNEGWYKAVFSLKIENPDTKEVVSWIYIEWNNNGQEWYNKEISVSDFKSSKYNEFELNFNIEKDNTEISPWVYYTGESTLYADEIKIIKLKEKNNFSIKTYDSIVFEENLLGRKTGTEIEDKDATNGKAVYVEEGKDPAHHIAFGPYSERELPWNHKAAFRLKTNNNKTDDVVAKLEVFNAAWNAVNKNLVVRGSDFLKENEYQNFEINFERTDKGSMEYRIYYYGVTNLHFDNITVFGPNKEEEKKVETEEVKEEVTETETYTDETEKVEESPSEEKTTKFKEEVAEETKTETTTGETEKAEEAPSEEKTTEVKEEEK